jgi:MFS family permease
VGVVAVTGVWHLPIIGAIRPWQSVFLVVGAPGLVVALLMLTVREPARRQGATGTLPIAVIAAYVRRHARTFATYSLGFAFSGLVNFAIAFWLATFLIRTYGWSAAHAGFVQGILTITIGVAGTLAGGRMADWYASRGRYDGPLRVGIIGALGMLVSASLYPVMPTAGWCVFWLAIVNFFAAFPWGAATAAAAEIVPAAMRAQGAALYFFVLNLISSALGPIAVGLATDHFFGESNIRYSLVLVNVIGMSIAVALFAMGMPAFRRTVAEVNAVPEVVRG